MSIDPARIECATKAWLSSQYPGNNQSIIVAILEADDAYRAAQPCAYKPGPEGKCECATCLEFDHESKVRAAHPADDVPTHFYVGSIETSTQIADRINGEPKLPGWIQYDEATREYWRANCDDNIIHASECCPDELRMIAAHMEWRHRQAEKAKVRVDVTDEMIHAFWAADDMPKDKWPMGYERTRVALAAAIAAINPHRTEATR